MTLASIASQLNLPSPPNGGEILIDSVVIDSREARPGSLFACFTGDRVDGHDFATSAVKNGASAILASHPITGVDAPILYIPNPTQALGLLASRWRDNTGATVVGLTGTSGKTTLKEALAAILRLAGKTARTEKNHNNQIGLPLSLLASAGDERFLVIEAGISHAGDMDDLGRILRPDLAIILNIGAGHVEGLGERGVAWHKTRLLKYLQPDGIALVSADYPELQRHCADLCLTPRLFSIENRDVEFKLLDGDYASGFYRFRLQGEILAVQTPFRGTYGAETALAAAAAARLLGVDCALIQRGLASLEPPPQRFNHIMANNWHIFDDTYNANPLSMRRMLEAAASFGKAKNLPLIAILGEMGELGSEAPHWHRELGKELAFIGPEIILWKGGFLDDVRAGLNEAGPGNISLVGIETPEDFVEIWREAILTKHDSGVALFKGSRANRLEECLHAITCAVPEGNAGVL